MFCHPKIFTTEESPMDFGKRIKEERTKLGFSQKEVAEALFVTRQTVSKWENGKSYPDLELLVALSDLFEISVDNLLKEDKKLMKFVEDNPQATKKQKLAIEVPMLLMVVIMWGAMIRCCFLDKFSPVMHFICVIMVIILTCAVGFITVQVAAVLRKKENPVSQNKRLTSPVHKMENIRTIAFAAMMLLGGVGMFSHSLVVTYTVIPLQIILLITYFIYTKKIQNKMNTRHLTKKFRDWKKRSKVIYMLVIALGLAANFYILYMAFTGGFSRR